MLLGIKIEWKGEMLVLADLCSYLENDGACAVLTIVLGQIIYSLAE